MWSKQPIQDLEHSTDVIHNQRGLASSRVYPNLVRTSWLAQQNLSDAFPRSPALGTSVWAKKVLGTVANKRLLYSSETLRASKIQTEFTDFLGPKTREKEKKKEKAAFTNPLLTALLADCGNSSPPLILRKFQGFRGIWSNSGKFGEFQENSGELCGIQWNSVWRLGWIQWEFLGDFGATPDFRENLGWFRVLWGVKRLLRK